VITVVAVVTPMLVRIAWEGRAELVAADEAAAAGRVDLEIVHLGRAVRWRVPIGGSDEAAIGRLLAIGAANQGDEASVSTALAAYRELRSALWATRAGDVADAQALGLANRRIAGLMAAQEREFGSDLSGVGRQEAYHLALLEAGPGDR
jgi:hypothetical protein